VSCANTPEPFTYEIEVRATDTGDAVANAVVRAEIGVRDVYQATSNANGVALLIIDGEHGGRWAKVIVDADDYKRQSVLVKLEGEKGSATVGLEPLSAGTPATQATTQGAIPAATESAASTSPVTTVHTGSTSIDDTGSSSQVIASGGVATLAPAERADYYQARPELTIDTNRTYRATIQTSKGDIKVVLDAGAAPEHVNNFIFLSNQGFYEGLTFHRVEPGFVIQGGDPLGNGSGGPGYTIPGEFKLKHIEGALAMARRPDQVNPNRESSGSQFYITLAPTESLDGQYSVFGHVEEGMDVVKAIEVGDTIERIVVEP
jgi:cyclophilin family peptidyl-prolyl cis-trans isomerase